MAERTVRRQQRGLQRMAHILQTSGALFASHGVEAVSTNRIAREAGISPGSLYQFFDSRDAIVAALVAEFATALDDIHAHSFASFDPATASLREVVDAVVDPVVGYKNEHAAFATMVARGQLPDRLIAPIVAVEADFTKRLTQTLSARNPDAPAELVATATQTMLGVFRGVIGNLSVTPEQPGVPVEELKSMLLGYLAQRALR